jgi:MerR family copper efflux transcriptional regulator
MSGIHIGQLAKKTGLSIDTIRFYEKQGLLSPQERSKSGTRHYHQDALTRAKFVQSAKQLGFTLKETRELIDLKVESKKTCTLVHRQASKKIREIDKKLAELHQIRDALQHLVASCRGGMPLEKCSLLEAL